MIEATLISFLETKLTVPVYAMRPEKDPGDYVIVEKTGSSVTNQIYDVTVALQSYSDTLLGAATLNEEVKEAMIDFYSETEVGRVKLVTDYNYTNTSAKKFRYQAVYNVIEY